MLSVNKLGNIEKKNFEDNTAAVEGAGRERERELPSNFESNSK